MATTLVERFEAASSRSSETCTHSSRVGTTTSACTPGAGSRPSALDEREAEAEGLAGAGLGLADDVLAGEGERDGLALDGERLDDALRGEGVDHVLVDGEIGESHGRCLSECMRSTPQSTRAQGRRSDAGHGIHAG